MNLSDFGINQRDIPLPADSDVIKFKTFHSLGSTIVIEMFINGILFKRIHDRALKRAKESWLDPEHTLEGPQMLDDVKSKDLEAIFQNYCIEYKFNYLDSLKIKRIKNA